MTDELKSRREAMGAVAVGAGVLVAASAAAQTRTQAMRLNPSAKSVMPNGATVSREQVLATLGLDPKTPPDAWLTIVACGSNASALKPGDLQELVRAGKINAAQLGAADRAKLRR